MKAIEPSLVFDQQRASTYDQRRAKMAPLADVLHLLTNIILAELPARARILCVGVGTGSELIDLALANPGWQFTALDPASAMLNICRERVDENGLTERCTFHEGYLESLPPSAPFDAATCFLVSHFLVQREKRIGFFTEIADRLLPGGILVSSDLAGDTTTPAYQSLLAVWLRLLKSADWPVENVEKLRVIYGRDVALLPLQEVEAILMEGGFEEPVTFVQTGLIHGWYSRRAEQ
jgi:tRNA (cmo5U34)-methyltransferase